MLPSYTARRAPDRPRRTGSLPDYAIDAIREALPAFERQIEGFALPDAVLTGVETRTSSPMRIKRSDATCRASTSRGLYPAGEGAGYAGGIMSAAVDGIKVAEAVAKATLNSSRVPSVNSRCMIDPYPAITGLMANTHARTLQLVADRVQRPRLMLCG